MPKKGDQARQKVAQTIIDAFSATGNFVCFQDKKIYITAKDGAMGELLQFAISMTMPKVPVAGASQTTAGTDGNESATGIVENTPPTPVEISPEDKNEVERLKQMLGIT